MWANSQIRTLYFFTLTNDIFGRKTAIIEIKSFAELSHVWICFVHYSGHTYFVTFYTYLFIVWPQVIWDVIKIRDMRSFDNLLNMFIFCYFKSMVLPLQWESTCITCHRVRFQDFLCLSVDSCFFLLMAVKTEWCMYVCKIYLTSV